MTPRKKSNARPTDAETQRLVKRLRKKVAQFYADHDNDSGRGLILPPDIADAIKQLRKLDPEPQERDWREKIWEQAEEIMSRHGSAAANDYLAANGLEDQY